MKGVQQRFLWNGSVRSMRWMVLVVALPCVMGQLTDAPDSPSPAVLPASATILGLPQDTVIMITAVLAFFVIAALLFVLHRLLSAAKRRERLLQRRLLARSRPSYEAPAPDVVTANDSDDGNSTLVKLESYDAIAVNSADDNESMLPLRTANTPRNSVELDPAEEGFDAQSVSVSKLRVKTWLVRDVAPLPPTGSPQFSSLKPTSFIEVSTSSSAARSVPPDSDPFGDIPTVTVHSTVEKPDLVLLRSPTSVCSDPFDCKV